METDKIFPGNWREVIQDKKVIFYNTGVGSLLHGRDRYIEKMDWVFQIFQKHPEVVLWWRPHPLELSTLNSMLPELEERYIELRQRYIGDHIGILDESVDLNRAIAVSDAYYGSWSSVVELFKTGKKPVLYENMKVRYEEDTSFLAVEFCIKDNTLWLLQAGSNKLVKMNINTYEIEKVTSIPCERRFWPYNCKMLDVGDRLLLLFGDSKKIYEYEIETGTVKIHELPIENRLLGFECAIVRDNKLFLFPYKSRDILEYNYRTYSMKKRRFGKTDVKVDKCYEMNENGTVYYLADEGSNVLYQYDIAGLPCTSIPIGRMENRYWGVKKCGSYFVLPNLDKKAITLWNEENGETVELTEFPEEYMYLEGAPYLDMFEIDNNIYIFPIYANMILKVSIENRTITQAFPEVFFVPDYDINSERFSRETYWCAKRYNNYIYAYASYEKSWHIFDLENMNFCNVSYSRVKGRELIETMEKSLDDDANEELFCEEESDLTFTLRNYIRDVSCELFRRRDSQCDKVCVGTRIYEFIAGEV